jgi:hypothetical protein
MAVIEFLANKLFSIMAALRKAKFIVNPQRIQHEETAK